MRKIKLLAVLMALSFWVVSPVLAQTSPPNQPADSGSGVVEVISTININSAAIISQSGSDLKIAFNLTGGKQIQPDLKYGVFLVVPGNGENIVADQKIYPETLVLAANSTIHKEITYTIPAWISGNFDVWVKVENSKGVLMSQDMAGNIKRNGQTDNFINIDSSSCSLQVDGTGQKYTLDQSPPVIAPSENLILTCDIKNNYGHNMTVIPNFVTHSQSLFGQIVSTNKQADLALAANTSKTATFTLPKAVVPQDYDMLFTLIDSQGQTVSNTLDVRYAIAGIIGVIQNFRIDKNSYAQGDAIQASFSWDIRQTNSVNAPEKEGMEGTGIYTDNGSASIAIASDGKTCISPFEKKLSDIATGPNSADIKFPVVANCPNPAVTVTLKDANGNVLDKLDFSTAKTAAGKTQPTGNTSNHNNTLLVLVVLLVTLAVILLIVIAHKKNWKNITRIGLFLVIIFLSGFWVKGSQADTIDLNFVHQSLDSNWKLYTAYTPIFNVTFDVAPQYNANEKID
ncbi:MAG: hypothetical protein P4L58_03645, partial [Candidatus Pacebacteria bacterium]|nr:hypothetical protein [Candidatus Paceibacterota bacterium]